MLLESLTSAVCDLAHQVKRVAEHMAKQQEQQAVLHAIADLKRTIMATQVELVAQAKAQTVLLNEISTELDTTLQKVKDLQEAVDNQSNASPELVDAMKAVSDQLQVVADKVPGSPTSPTPPAA